jgi:hypothetical protein
MFHADQHGRAACREVSPRAAPSLRFRASASTVAPLTPTRDDTAVVWVGAEFAPPSGEERACSPIRTRARTSRRQCLLVEPLDAARSPFVFPTALSSASRTWEGSRATRARRFSALRDRRRGEPSPLNHLAAQRTAERPRLPTSASHKASVCPNDRPDSIGPGSGAVTPQDRAQSCTVVLRPPAQPAPRRCPSTRYGESAARWPHGRRPSSLARSAAPAAWRGRMLTIGKIAAGPAAGRYYVDQVAQGREDYYAGEGEAPGTWIGSGARSLGLSGEVAEQGIVRLLEARDPRTGELLRRPLAHGAVAGFDLTFRAPKSVSILFAIAEPDVVREITRAHEAAVAAAIGYMEREACRARRGHGGAQQVDGRGFVTAAFRHRSSRAGDPLLHTHVVVANVTQGPGRAVDGARRAAALPAFQDRGLPAVLPLPPPDADRRGGGRPLPRLQGPRARPLGRVDQHDDHPPRPDPGGRGGAGSDPAQPSPREHAQPEAQDQAQAARIPRVGRPDRRDDRPRNSTPNRRRAPPAVGRSSRRWFTPACGSGRRRRCAGATSTSPTAASPSATRRPRPASGSSTSSRRSATS